MSLLFERGTIALHEKEQATSPKRARGLGRFAVRSQLADRHIVVPDIHGEYKVLEKVVDQYINQQDIDFVFLGDILDRKGVVDDPERGVFRSLDMIKELGTRAVVTMANHEWYFHASAHAENPTLKEEFTKEWLGTHSEDGIERNVLTAYDIDSSRRSDAVIEELCRRMARVGHLVVLTNATPYFETETFIATHAGLMTDVSWDVQRGYLEDVSREMDEGLFYDRPPQWFSMKLATSTKPIDHTDTTISPTRKTIVSGHAHTSGRGGQFMSHERSLHDGKRIRLASTLNAPTKAPAYIWQDWDGQIVEIPQGVQ